MEEYDRKQRERDQLLREADEKCDRLEREARENADASRMRNQRDVNDRAKMVAEREKKRVDEGFYDPHRLGKMQEERKRRQQIERDKQAAARHEADSVARYLAAQNERDDARRMADERNERLRKERMQRLIEMETDDEIDRMRAKDEEDRRRWEADRWWRDLRWAWRTVTSRHGDLHHIYIVYRYTKHPRPIVYSPPHMHHIYIVYRYTKHQGPCLCTRAHTMTLST